MKYVFLDTCVIVDCAFTRKEKTNPKLLERLMERLRENDVKLLLPEVVQLELEKVLPQTMSVAVESIGAVKKSVQEVAENSLLSHSVKTKLLDAVKDARAELNSDVKDALDLINQISNEPDNCIVLPLMQEDLIVATKMAIKGNKPSKRRSFLQLAFGIKAAGVRFRIGTSSEMSVPNGALFIERVLRVLGWTNVCAWESTFITCMNLVQC